MGFIWIFYFVVVILMIASMWKIFTKAGEPGWAAIVPIYNLVVLLKIIDKHSGGWGHTVVDHIFQSDKPMPSSIPANLTGRRTASVSPS